MAVKTTKEHLLDPEILSKTENYYLMAKTVVEGFIAGLHRSLYHGFGSEFVHYRDYTPGDDIKYIDWKAYARLNKHYIKVFQEETNTNCYVILDSSASMAYKSENSPLSKLDYGKIIVACLSYMVNRQGDNVGFYAYSDNLRCCIKPGHRSGQVQNICSQLKRLTAEGAGQNKTILGKLAEMFKRRGLIVIISDFLDTDDGLKKAIRYYRVAHHDCLLFHILDSDEVHFPFVDTVRFIDSESGLELTTAPELVREQYLKSIHSHFADIENFCFRDNIDYNRVMTSENLAGVLAAYLHKRELFS